MDNNIKRIEMPPIIIFDNFCFSISSIGFTKDLKAPGMLIITLIIITIGPIGGEINIG